MKLMGERVYLDTLSREDCRAIYDQYTFDPELLTEQPSMGVATEQADGWYDDIQKQQGSVHVRLGVFRREDGLLLGDFALQDINWYNRSCSVGIGLLAAARGKGYAPEALRLLVVYGFGMLGLERIEASTLDVNIPAQRTLERVGFRPEGRQRGAVYIGGQRRDRLLYGLLRDEFGAVQLEVR